jgi:hypothetical protein
VRNEKPVATLFNRQLEIGNRQSLLWQFIYGPVIAATMQNNDGGGSAAGMTGF